MRTVRIREIVIGEGIPKICVPITGKSRAEIEEETRQVKEMNPDLVEWRADCYEEGKNLKKCPEMLKTIRDILGEIPLLFTVRTDKEGGNVQITFEDYVNLLEEAARTGCADMIDVEIYFEGRDTENLIRSLQKQGVFVVASNHHFHETPSVDEMICILKEMDRKGADVLKLAVMPRCEEEVYTLLQATVKMKEETEKPVITMSMGKTGVLSRLCGETAGSAVTFAAGIRASAPGQIPVKHMRDTLLLLHESFT
ncbi:MAG: type I 3-dehydroquinate dehydratase [Blautia sp.]